MPLPALLARKGTRKSVIQYPNGLKINSGFSISKSLQKSSELPSALQGKLRKHWTPEKMMLAALPKSALARAGPLTAGAGSTFRGNIPLYLPELAHPTEQQPWGASAVGWTRRVSATLPACSPPRCSGRSIEQLQNRTQRYTTQIQVSKQNGGGKQKHPTAEQSLPWIITFFKSQIKSLTAAQHTADRSFIYLSRKRGSAYTRLRNCLVKPLPHYLTFSEKMIVNYFITGKEAFRLVYQNRSHIYPGQGTACKPKQ